MAGRRVVVFPSSAELGPALAQLVTSRAARAISSQGRFTLGLSGGSLVSMLSKELLALPDLDCSKWVVGFCDERLVPCDDPESTYGLYKVPTQPISAGGGWVMVCNVWWLWSSELKEAVFHLQNQLFSKVNISDSGILTIDPSLSVNECAEDYARKLKEVQNPHFF